jgi:hypothetical protein
MEPPERLPLLRRAPGLGLVPPALNNPTFKDEAEVEPVPETRIPAVSVNVMVRSIQSPSEESVTGEVVNKAWTSPISLVAERSNRCRSPGAMVIPLGAEPPWNH